MTPIEGGISPEMFYGRKSEMQERIEKIIENEENTEIFERPRFMRQLLGPSSTWKVFKKQQDAIDCCLKRRNGLMCFAFEDVNSRRMFLVAHPKVFWSFNHKRFFKKCNTYEVIREYSACKLYLDLEYEYEYNRDRDQEGMLNNLLNIINFNLNDFFQVDCKRTDILDLDSSSDRKFSRHIIYQIKYVAFENNYAVGNFIGRICDELRQAYESNSDGNDEKLIELSKKYGVKTEDILQLFIRDRKGKVKLFVDEGVYTKNRHFRILGSSKQSKNIPLVPSKRNEYKSIDSSDCGLFADSLVTCFSWAVDRVLSFSQEPEKKRKFLGLSAGSGEEERPATINSSIHPEIDSFINGLIHPRGRIRRKIFFGDTSRLVYEIQGFRRCENVQREHKSNNIKYVVDLQGLTWYQKCYDPDCFRFRSDSKPLPEDIRFLFRDDSDDFPDEDDFARAFQENEISFDSADSSSAEEELAKAVDCAEAILDVDWS